MYIYIYISFIHLEYVHQQKAIISQRSPLAITCNKPTYLTQLLCGFLKMEDTQIAMGCNTQLVNHLDDLGLHP